MPISRPITRTIISTIAWGIPITDEVNALRTLATSNTPTAWTAVAFQNGWTNVGGEYQIMQYRKIGDVVYLRGFVKSGTLNTAAFTLPAGFRSLTTMQVASDSFNGSANVHALFAVFATGEVKPQVGSAQYGIWLTCNFSTI